MEFEQFPLKDGTLNAIAAMGYETATPIQAEAIGPLLEKKDVVGQARTGTGKTAAFGIPMVDALRDETKHVVGLILVPTRELAIQVTEVLTDLTKASRLNVVAVYGGAGFQAQTAALGAKGAKIVVATPGRLLDLVQRGDLLLDRVKFLVLDEADRMLDMGFVHDMRRIRKLLPIRVQTALFTATLPGTVEKLVSEFTNKPVRIKTDDGETTVPKAEQFVMHVEKAAKQDTLLHLLHAETPERGVVFTRTKHLAKRLAQRLSKNGWSAVALQGNMTQNQRERAMEAFRNGDARLLVATDVAARGLDVPGITHVVNFDIPDEDQYVHRVGRTARNGASGRAFTFVQSDERKDLKAVERFAGRVLEKHHVTVTEEPPEGPDDAPRIVNQTASQPRKRAGRNGRPGGRQSQSRPPQGRPPQGRQSQGSRGQRSGPSRGRSGGRSSGQRRQ